ncbi:ABC transporter ATP-binding protein [Afifella sp. IM 167]|nr:ABC transporter ATP-binding protein [Afifella sp. IM 167]
MERGGRQLLDIDEIVLDGAVITAIMGPNGAGKTLLLRCLAGLQLPDSGEVSWAGMPPDRARALRLGFVFQKPVLLRRSVLANLVFALKAGGLPGRQARIVAGQALKAARLERLARSPARLLSGGEQQRLALARALALKPDILFLDEPTVSLDPGSAVAIEAMVRSAAAAGTKCVLVSHDIGQARRLAEEVIFLSGGRITERAAAPRFFREPQSREAKAYLAGEILA